MAHPFGELLAQYRARKRGLSQAKLAEWVGYDPAVIARMCQGHKDLTGPTGRTKVLRIIAVLHERSVLQDLAEANALLAAANLPPLFERIPTEAIQITAFRAAEKSAAAVRPITTQALPSPISSFIGREDEISAVITRLKSARLLTLVGAGGSGKTRLALQIVQQLIEASSIVQSEKSGHKDFADGIWWIELANIQAGEFLPETVAHALGINTASGDSATTTITQRLQSRHTLLVLDNCEHVLEASIALVVALLQSCPHLKILTTSRESLNVMGETLWQVSGLDLPPAYAIPDGHLGNLPESMELFYERAAAVNQYFKRNHRNDTTVARICRKLEGMPLGIELAAVQMKSMSIAEIAHQLDDHLALLTTSHRMASPRHQALSMAIDWSYRMLTEHERNFFQHMSVFVGGWTLQAAQAVTNGEQTAPEILSRLVDKSLIIGEDHNQSIRYRMLEPIRQFAHAKLCERGEEATLLQAHFEYFLAFAERMDSQLTEWPLNAWLVSFEAEHDNIRVALVWSRRVANHAKWAQASLRLVHAWRFCLMNHGQYAEGRNWLLETLYRNNLVDVPEFATLRAKALTTEVPCLLYLGRWPEFTRIEEHAQRCLTLCQALADVDGQAHALQSLGYVAWVQKANAQAVELAYQAINLFHSIQHIQGYWSSSFLLWRVLQAHGKRREAIAAMRLAADTLINWGDRWYFGNLLQAMAGLLIEEGEFQEASNVWIFLIDDAEKIDDRLTHWWGFESLQTINYPMALELAGTYLERQRREGDTHTIAQALHQLGRILLDEASSHESLLQVAAILDESVQLWRKLGPVSLRSSSLRGALLHRGQVAHFQGDPHTALAYYDEAYFYADQVGDQDTDAMVSFWRAQAMLMLGNSESALLHIRRAFAHFCKMQWTASIIIALAPLSLLWQQQGEFAAAARLAGFAERNESLLRSVHRRFRRDYDRIIQDARGRLGDPAWAEGQAMTLEQVLDWIT